MYSDIMSKYLLRIATLAQQEKMFEQKMIKTIPLLLLLCSLFLTSTSSYAAQPMTIQTENWVQAIMLLLGGITFLLYGLRKMTASFKALAGDKLRFALSRLTTNRVSSLATGMTITALIQSSAATTAMVVSFISARLMTLPQSLGVILGADIGTTITVQLIAFKVNQYALLPLAIGFFLQLISRKERLKHTGGVLMNIGLIYYGIYMIGESMSGLQNLAIFDWALKNAAVPFIGLLMGLIITTLMQSSAASLAVIIAISSQTLVSLEAAFYLIMGANMGSCTTAYIMSIGGKTDSRRAASAHILFKVTGVTLALIISPWIIDWMKQLQGSFIYPREIAHIHTILNISIAILFLPFTGYIAQLLSKHIKKKRKRELVPVKYLDESLLNTPSIALNIARMEAVHMSERVNKMLKISCISAYKGDSSDLGKIALIEREVDALYRQIIAYLAKISKGNLSIAEGEQLMWLMNCVNRIETISDLAGGDIQGIGRKRLQSSVIFSLATRNLFDKLHNHVCEMFNHSQKMLAAEDTEHLSQDLPNKEDFGILYQKMIQHQAKRLIADEKDRIRVYSLEMDLVEKLQRIYYLSRKNAAKTLEHYEKLEESNED